MAGINQAESPVNTKPKINPINGSTRSSAGGSLNRGTAISNPEIQSREVVLA